MIKKPIAKLFINLIILIETFTYSHLIHAKLPAHPVVWMDNLIEMVLFLGVGVAWILIVYGIYRASVAITRPD